jgi:imidazolonepropionase-like amidohydrolase
MFAVKAGNAFDGERQLRGGAVIFVDEGKIVGVAPAAAPLPDGCAVTEFPGATILPGLIDTHVHLGGVTAATARSIVWPTTEPTNWPR